MHFMGLLVIHTMAIEMTKEPWDEAKVKISGSAVTHHRGNYAREPCMARGNYSTKTRERFGRFFVQGTGGKTAAASKTQHQSQVTGKRGANGAGDRSTWLKYKESR